MEITGAANLGVEAIPHCQPLLDGLACPSFHPCCLGRDPTRVAVSFCQPVSDSFTLSSHRAPTDMFLSSGQNVEITLANGDHRSLNVNCTAVPSNGTVPSPTIWLEADQAHGIVDFMGLQRHLAVSHGRNSCAYDPPNFGWSARLPAKSKTYYEYFGPMLKAMGRQDEEIVLVGWGGGAEQAVRHAVELPIMTRGLVLLDVSPDGIEWRDEKRINNWTEEAMLQRRDVDLAGRVALSRIVLALGIPW